MEHFLNLPPEKRDNIINAALYLFGRSGYKKTSAADIAAKAGISKPMIFHYFGSKKNLYLYLIDFCGNVVSSGVLDRIDKNEKDFFGRIRLSAEIKLSVIGEYPDMLSFMESMFFETDPDVENEIKKILTLSGSRFDFQQFFEGVDYSRFKDGINPALVTKTLIYFVEGIMNETPRGQKVDIDALMREFDECLGLFRNNFYKE